MILRREAGWKPLTWEDAVLLVQGILKFARGYLRHSFGNFTM